jgi:hypothetical protein
METPVIYFYSQEARKVDVEVKFPRGLITEWYPQAHQIGPSTIDTSKVKSRSAGPASDDSPYVTAASAASWSALEIMDPIEGIRNIAAYPEDSSGSHYYEARHTRANTVRAHANPGTPEIENFVFYRGVANFAAPLTVLLDEGNKITISNAGSEALQNVFVLNLRNREGEYVSAGNLPAYEAEMFNSIPRPISSPKTSCYAHSHERCGSAHSAGIIPGGSGRHGQHVEGFMVRGKWYPGALPSSPEVDGPDPAASPRSTTQGTGAGHGWPGGGALAQWRTNSRSTSRGQRREIRQRLKAQRNR